jgi:hypothetical protein
VGRTDRRTLHDGRVLKQLSEAVGLLAAVVGAVYLLGAAVLALRLQTNDIPTLPVLSNLPRELVISYGLTYAVVWWLLAAVVVAVFWLALQRAPSGRFSREPRRVRWSGGAAILAALVGLSWGAAALVLNHLDGTFTLWDQAALAAGVVAAALLARGVWKVLAARYRREWSAPVAVAVAAALTGLIVVPTFMEIGVRAPLAEAQLCVAGPTHLNGYLVGEAGDRVYLGENVDPHRLVSAPRTGELYVGPKATEKDLCRAERVGSPPRPSRTSGSSTSR